MDRAQRCGLDCAPALASTGEFLLAITHDNRATTSPQHRRRILFSFVATLIALALIATGAPGASAATRDDFATGVAATGEGIVAAGYSCVSEASPPECDFAVAKYRADGSLDPTFGFGGKILTDFDSRVDLGYALAARPSGEIIVAGQSQPESGDAHHGRIAIAQYLPDGRLDSSFSIDGKVLEAMPCRNLTHHGSNHFSAALDADGRIVVAFPAAECDVHGNYVDEDFMVVRYLPDGTRDTTFGLGGSVRIDFPPADDPGDTARPHGLAINPADGSITVVGSQRTRISSSLHDSDIAVSRLTSNGLLDMGFGINGMFSLDTSEPEAGVTETLDDVAVDSQGRMLAAGRCIGNNGLDCPARWLAARFTDSGTDAPFGDPRLVAAPDTASSAVSVATQPDDAVVIGGSPNVSLNDAAAHLVRLNSDGSRDANFGSAGASSFQFEGQRSELADLAPLDGGQLLAAGRCSCRTGAQVSLDFGVARLDENGRLIAAFGDDGTVHTDFGDTAVGDPPPDTDGDGVVDDLDQCPTVPGQPPSGCPPPPPGTGGTEQNRGDPYQDTAGAGQRPDIVAIGDSVTAAFGYRPDGREIRGHVAADPMAACIDQAANPQCSSPEVIAWPAVYAAAHDLNLKNYAHSGSEPKDWLVERGKPGKYVNDLNLALAGGGPRRAVTFTLGANPLLERLLKIDDWEHFKRHLCVRWLWHDRSGCIARELDRVAIVPRLTRLYKTLVQRTDAPIYVMLYHDTRPVSLIGAPVKLLLSSLNARLAHSVTRTLKELPKARGQLRVASPPSFRGHYCFRLNWEPIVPDPWVLWRDSCVHPTAAGHRQFAAALGRTIDAHSAARATTRQRRTARVGRAKATGRAIRVVMRTSAPGPVFLRLVRLARRPQARLATRRSGKELQLVTPAVTLARAGRQRVRVRLTPTARKNVARARRHGPVHLRLIARTLSRDGRLRTFHRKMALGRL